MIFLREELFSKFMLKFDLNILKEWFFRSQKQEGANNEKFDSHPSDPRSVPAYLVVHNNWYYGLDLFTSSLLLLLALGEDPAVPALKVKFRKPF